MSITCGCTYRANPHINPSIEGYLRAAPCMSAPARAFTSSELALQVSRIDMALKLTEDLIMDLVHPGLRHPFLHLDINVQASYPGSQDIVADLEAISPKREVSEVISPTSSSLTDLILEAPPSPFSETLPLSRLTDLPACSKLEYEIISEPNTSDGTWCDVPAQNKVNIKTEATVVLPPRSGRKQGKSELRKKATNPATSGRAIPSTAGKISARNKNKSGKRSKTIRKPTRRHESKRIGGSTEEPNTLQSLDSTRREGTAAVKRPQERWSQVTCQPCENENLPLLSPVGSGKPSPLWPPLPVRTRAVENQNRTFQQVHKETGKKRSGQSIITNPVQRPTQTTEQKRTLGLPPTKSKHEKRHNKHNLDLKASKFCHVCARTRTSRKMRCSNLMTEVKCRKAVCEPCFEDMNWDFEKAAKAPKLWLCPHCTGLCPQIRKARCHIYKRVNRRRREAKVRGESDKSLQ